jgi:hypothetical protein
MSSDACSLQYAFGITTIMGLALPAAIKLSMITLALPIVGQASSSPPLPCSRYSTGYRVVLSSYPDGVYTIMRRAALRAVD